MNNVRLASAPSAAQSDPQPIISNYSPRALRFIAKDVVRYDFTAECAGC